MLALSLALLVVAGLALPRKKRKRVRVTIGDAVIEEDMSDPIDRMVALAVRDEERWQELDEDDQEAEPMLDEYWSGTGVDGRAKDLHWSGAWIQWLANKGAPGSLPQLAQHSAYARAALGERRPGKFQTLPPGMQPEVGDIILKPRPGEERSYEELLQEPFAPFPSHGDFVVEVSPFEVVAIGGNKMGDRVASEVYPRANDGTVEGIFAILRLNREQQNA